MKLARSYIIGYILSIALTLAVPALLWLHAYTQHTTPSHEMLAVLFVLLALLQLFVQLFFFLHLGKGDAQTRWNVGALGFTLIIVTILVGGTLWIMSNLSHLQASGHMPDTPNIFQEENIFPTTDERNH